jgi:drug/metabolite transporter (DMT)-like permease
LDRWLKTEREVRVCAVAGAITIAFSGILVRLSHASPSTAAMFRCLYALPVLGLIVWSERRRYGPRSWSDRRFAVIAGLFFSVDMIMWNRSIEDVGAGLSTVLANIQVVLVPLVAWFVLSERPGRRVLAALPIAMLGVLLISGAVDHEAYGRDPLRGTLYGLGAGITYVGFLLFLRHSGSDVRRPAGPLFEATLTAGLMCAVLGVIFGDVHFVPVFPGVAWLILLAMSSQVFGWLLIMSSLPRLPAATTSLLLTVQPVGTVFLAALIFAESPSDLQLLGVTLVVIGLVVATQPGRRRAVRVQAIAGASGRRSSAACMSASENSGSSSSPARNASYAVRSK